jgi:site-specific recombinase XerD
MSKQPKTTQKWAVASVALQEAYTDFILSRQAMLCSEQTVLWYGKTTGKFVSWLESQNISSASEINAMHPRAYLAELAGRKLASSTIHGHARAIKTYLRFCFSEGYLASLPTLRMPKLARKKLPCLSKDQLKSLLKECRSKRDKALLMFLADTGLRRAEVLALNWIDVDISKGIVHVLRGKGGKYRSVMVGVLTRRALLAYRREVLHDDEWAVFQTINGTRLSPNGLRSLLLRIGKRAELHITPHMLRRTFATLALRNGMNLIELQGLLGHASLQMTERYVQLLTVDYSNAHRQYGPIDNL